MTVPGLYVTLINEKRSSKIEFEISGAANERLKRLDVQYKDNNVFHYLSPLLNTSIYKLSSIFRSFSETV